jgi:hypothetical protein
VYETIAQSLLPTAIIHQREQEEEQEMGEQLHQHKEEE